MWTSRYAHHVLAFASSPRINTESTDNLHSHVHPPADWWCQRCSRGSPAWCFFSCNPSSGPRRDSSRTAVAWHTYHTGRCSTSQWTVLRGKTQGRSDPTSPSCSEDEPAWLHWKAGWVYVTFTWWPGPLRFLERNPWPSWGLLCWYWEMWE